MKKTIIFDMDGVIIDSELFYKDRMYDFLKNHVDTIDRQTVYRTAGMGRDACKKFIEDVTGIPAHESYALYTEYKKQHYIKDYQALINEDALGLLTFCRNNGFLVALASNTTKETLDRKITGCGLEDAFDCIVSGDQVTRMKPDPDIYLKVAQLLHMDPKQCIVIEDSAIGIQAGKNAGMYVVARKHQKLVADVSTADYVTHDLRDLIPVLEESNQGKEQ